MFATTLTPMPPPRRCSEETSPRGGHERCCANLPDEDCSGPPASSLAGDTALRWFPRWEFRSKTIAPCARSTTVDPCAQARILAKAPGPEETNEKTPKITFFQRSTVDAKKKRYPLLVDLFLCVDRRPLKKCAFDPIFVSLFGARCLCQNSHLCARVDRCRPCAGSKRLETKFPKGKPTQRGAAGWPAARCNLHRVERSGQIDWPPLEQLAER